MIQKTIIAFSLLLVSQLGMAQQAQYVEGTHFFLLDQAPAQTDSGNVEVTEIFSYACSHCNTFEPYMQSWKKNNADKATLKRIPVTFGRKSWELLARGYIAAEMMGIAEESHVGMMDAIWKQRKQFRSLDELADFYAGFGVEKDAFKAHYQSFAADSQLRRNQKDIITFGISGTPSLVVNSKYRVVSSKDVPDFDVMLDVVNYLVAKESATAESKTAE
ncbi:MAG: thioredoxin domain-containing protein [Xanthomonadales bacterium]|nr:thioredoxin domain-containing protein [Xanthomonadales bacterium]